MTKTKKYWKGLADLNNSPIVKKLEQNEFVEEIPVDEFLSSDKVSSNSTSRRDFLKFLGFSTAAATLVACEAPIVKSIPYVTKPEEIIPGVANFYATTMYDGHDFASILVKTREGRPIKIEANKTSTNARVQASVLSLYDSSRLKNPTKNGKSISYSKIDKEIINSLDGIIKSGEKRKVVILTPTVLSPSTEKIIAKFSSKYPRTEHVQLDSTSSSSILEANENVFGVRALTNYHFDKPEVIVSFGADFIGNWGSPENEGDYVRGRNPKNGKMSKHYQIESTLTLTGSNADERIQIKPSEQIDLIKNLYENLKNTDKSQTDKRLKKIVEKLDSSRGRSIVVCDNNNTSVQELVNAINYELGNYDYTMSISKPSYLKKGDDSKISALLDDMNNGEVAALITHNVNPVYTLQDSKKYVSGLKNVDLKIACSLYNDESASKMTYCIPDSHYLESWGDAHPKHGLYTFMQPTIAPLFKSRQIQNSLLKWISEETDYYTILKDYYLGYPLAEWIASNDTYSEWKKGVDNKILEKRKKLNPITKDWDNAVHDGYCIFEESVYSSKYNFNIDNIKLSSSSNSKGIEFQMSEKISMGDGQQSNNPWLQELPDPLSRACWDNYLTMSASTARMLGVKNWNVSNGALNGSLVNITVNKTTFKNVPVMIQPGQANNTVSMAIGYGRTKAGKCGNGIGFNAFKLGNGTAKIKLVEGEYEFAATQLHHTMMGRDMIVKETSLSEYIKDPSSGNKPLLLSTHEGKQPPNKISLWDDHDHKTGHFWNQSIDLTMCTGCAACVIACHAENNVPVVGKEEVRKSRDMHWLRIDRYFSSEMTKEKAKKDNTSAITMYSEMEDPSENPEVVFQPVMCQHCNHAPCETVCPVAATTHSAEGLNHMTYNRCVGTRYCANNCPYKVRRFNWFQYSDNEEFDFNMNDDYGKMVLNPDVTVRSRGVIEKCSMCIQMIQATKLKAKIKGEPLEDKDVQTACSAACSTGAIVFGDANNEEHEIASLKKDERAYHLLDHLNTAPSVFYQTKIRNKS